MKKELFNSLLTKFPSALIILSMCLQGCVSSNIITGKEYYTKANIWYTNPKLIKSTNYHMGAFIPFGTKVSIERHSGSKLVFTGGDNLSYEILLVRKHSTISMAEYFDRYFSEVDPRLESGLFDSFSDEEKENILKGNVVENMSREAVLASYGYPPSHVTKDIKHNFWRYWVAGRQEVWVSFISNRVQSIEKVSVSGPPPGRKQITKVSSLLE